MVMSLPERLPVTPVGKPTNIASVTPVVLYVISVIAVPTQTLWLFVPDAEVRVMAVLGCTVMVPVAVTSPQLPVTSTV